MLPIHLGSIYNFFGVNMAYVVDYAITSGGAVTNTLMNMPQHQTNDLLVMFTVLNAGGVTIDTAGWTAVSNNNTAGTANTSSWSWKVAASSAETLQIDTTDDYACIIVSVRDADVGAGAAVINASSHLGTATSTSEHTSVAVTTTQADCLILYFIGVDGVATASHSNPGVHHILSFDNGGGNAGAATTNAAAWTIQRAAGATPTRFVASWTSSVAGTAARATIAIKNAAGGRIPAYVDPGVSTDTRPATTLVAGHHIGTLNNIVLTTTLTTNTAINSKTINAQAAALQADLGINPFSSGLAPTAAAEARTSLRGYQATLTGNRDMTTGLVVGSFIGATPKQGAFGIGSVAQGGCVVRIGSGASNWEAYQVAAKDAIPNPVSRAVWAVRPGYTGSAYGTPGSATTVSAVSFLQFFYNAPDFSSQAILSDVYLAKTHVVAGGTSTVPVDAEGLISIGSSYRLPVIQQQGAASVLSYVPIQIGGGDAVNFVLEGAALQFPRRYDTAKKEISFHAPDNTVGISYAGKSGDVIKHINSVITSPTPYYWEINTAATNAATWDFSGLVVIGATVTLRNVMTFTDMTFNTFQSVNASSCSLLECSFTEPPSTSGSITINGSSSFSFCEFDTTTITAGNSLIVTATPGVFNNSTFIGSNTSGHAIQITTPGTYSFTNLTFNGYGGTPGTNSTPSSGSTSAAIYNNSGGVVTINSSGGSQPSVRNGAGATTVVSSSYVLTLTNIIAGTQVTIVNSSTRAELQNSIADGTGIITYTHGGTGTIDILLINLSYDPTLSNVYDLVLTSENTSIKFQMIDDTNYANP